MVRAITFTQYGPPEVLRLVDIDEPTAGPGQVRVRVKAAGVQPADARIRAGLFAQWMPVAFPARLGNEFAGVVDQVGAGVSGVTVGDEVLGWAPMTAYAEAITVGWQDIVAKPARMSWNEAGVLSASGQTADTALAELGVRAGETVLIHAAAGGVGGYAVQIARDWGATVVGTASERNHAYLRSLGAIPVTYGEGLADRIREAAPEGIDAALDGIGGDALRVSLEVVKDHSRIGTIADRRTADQLGIRWLSTQRSATRLRDLTTLYTEGGLTVTVSAAYPLAEAPAAHHEIETGHVRGKIALTVG